MSNKNNINIKDKNFRREVGVAKSKYRKKRFSIFLMFNLIIIISLSIKIYISIKEKKDLDYKIESQNQEIINLEKENKHNEFLISKFKDPYFITDLVRQEYQMSYPGEIIFRLPIKENFIDNLIQSSDISEIKSNDDQAKLIDEEKLEKLLKRKEDGDKNKKEDNKKENNKDDTTKEKDDNN